MHKEKIEKLHSQLTYNEELKKLNCTPEVEREIENYKKQIDTLTAKKFHQSFYDTFVKPQDKTAQDLKEDSWVKFDNNILNQSRKAHFSTRIAEIFSAEKAKLTPATPVPVPVINLEPEKKIEKPKEEDVIILTPLPTAPRSSTATIAQVIPNKRPATTLLEEPEGKEAKVVATRQRRKLRVQQRDPDSDYSDRNYNHPASYSRKSR